jgi:hypothetical protein
MRLMTANLPLWKLNPAAACAAGLLLAPAWAVSAQHDEEVGEIDVPIGITPQGQIGFAGFDFDELFGLDFEFFADGTDPAGQPLSGLFTDNPGFRDLISAGVSPSADFAQPSGVFDFRFELLSIDAPLRMASPSFDAELAVPGETFAIGTQETLAVLGEIDSHPFFFIAAEDVVQGQILSVTGRVFDATGGFAASEPFTFSFVVPTPGSAALLGLAGLASARRRR